MAIKKPSNQTPITTSRTPEISVFNQAVKKFSTNSELKDMLTSQQVESSLLPGETNFISFNRPTDILVSRWYPGFRVTDLTGPDADESLGFMLADEIDDTEALYEFQRLLSNPNVASSIIQALLPRRGVPVRRGKYLMSEDTISLTTREVLATLGETKASVVAAVSHVIIRVLAKLGLVLASADQKIVKVASSFAVSASDLRRLILVESMRDIFSDARLAEVTRSLDQDATPEIIGEVIGRMIRHAANSIPEINLRMEQINMVQTLVHRYYVDPRSLSQVMQAYSGLISLAAYANFTVWASNQNLSDHIIADNADLKEACNNVLTLIQSAPSIESMALSKYSSHFGMVPGNSAGLYRGVVLYLPLNQVSRMDVMQTQQKGDGYLVNQQPAEYAPVSRLSDELNKSLLNTVAMEGLANLVADEMSQQPFVIGEAPSLLTLGVSRDELKYLAIARAQSLSFVLNAEKGPSLPMVVYGVDVSEQFVMNVGAASPGTVFFSDPAAVIVYGFGASNDNNSQQPVPVPARSQSWALPIGMDHNFKGDISKYLSTKVEEVFKIRLPIELIQADGELRSIEILISALPILMPTPRVDGTTSMVDNGGVHYSTVMEPGIDKEVRLMLALIAEYIKVGNRVLADKANSWVIETLGNAMQHPVVVGMAIKAVNKSLVDARLDGRRLKSQFNEVMIYAYFSTLMAIMTRFNKVAPEVALDLIQNVPTSGLSVKASALLLSMPMQLNASALLSGNS